MWPEKEKQQGDLTNLPLLPTKACQLLIIRSLSCSVSSSPQQET